MIKLDVPRSGDRDSFVLSVPAKAGHKQHQATGQRIILCGRRNAVSCYVMIFRCDLTTYSSSSLVLPLAQLDIEQRRNKRRRINWATRTTEFALSRVLGCELIFAFWRWKSVSGRARSEMTSLPATLSLPISRCWRRLSLFSKSTWKTRKKTR